MMMVKSMQGEKEREFILLFYCNSPAIWKIKKSTNVASLLSAKIISLEGVNTNL